MKRSVCSGAVAALSLSPGARAEGCAHQPMAVRPQSPRSSQIIVPGVGPLIQDLLVALMGMERTETGLSGMACGQQALSKATQRESSCSCSPPSRRRTHRLAQPEWESLSIVASCSRKLVLS